MQGVGAVSGVVFVGRHKKGMGERHPGGRDTSAQLDHVLISTMIFSPTILIKVLTMVVFSIQLMFKKQAESQNLYGKRINHVHFYIC